MDTGLDNNVNKPSSKSATPVKVNKSRKKKAEDNRNIVSTNNVTTADESSIQVTYADENDTITIVADGQDKEFFEEGEISSDDEVTINTDNSQKQSKNNNAALEVPAKSDNLEEDFNSPESKRFRELVAGDTFVLVKNMMEKSGLLQAAEIINNKLGQDQQPVVQVTQMQMPQQTTYRTKKVTPPDTDRHRTGNVNTGELVNSRSNTTIYENAVRDETGIRSLQQNDMTINQNRFSSSSDEADFNSSGELNKSMVVPEMTRLSDNLRETDLITDNQNDRCKSTLTDPLPGTSSGHRGYDFNAQLTEGIPHKRSKGTKQNEMTPKQQADKFIREAESAKARILGTQGKTEQTFDLNKKFVHSAMVDEDYLLVASHVDSVTYNKIVQGEYVDFAKLIPKDKILQEDDK